MNRKLVLVLSIVMGLLCLLTWLVAAQQLISNPDFNGGASWNFYFWNGWQQTFYSAAYNHSPITTTGSGFLHHIEDPSTNHDGVYFDQSFVVTPGISYAGSFWLYDDTNHENVQGEPSYCTNGPYPVWWAVWPDSKSGGCSADEPPPGSEWDLAFNWGEVEAPSHDTWTRFEWAFNVPSSYTGTNGLLCFYTWWDGGVSECGFHAVDDVYLYHGAPITSTPPAPPPFECNLENYSFDDGLEEWDYGDFVVEGDGWIGLHECTDQLNSYVSQEVALSATGPSEHYEISISAKAPYPVDAGSEPLLRWKLDSLIPGDSPDWFGGQMHIYFDEWWQHTSAYLRESNSTAITDTLTIWTANEDVQIDYVCITFHSGPATMTPVCPISPTYTPYPTYTPLPTPTAVNSATATAWAATATAWATQEPYPTQAPPNCDSAWEPPDWSFIWLMGQLLLFLGAFFEAIFKLLGTVLQPLFDLFGFLLWLIGAFFSLMASLIDLIAAAVQFLFSFVVLFFNILEMLGSFISALWGLLTMAPTDPGVEIPMYFYWGIAVWDFLIEGTPLEYLEVIAFALGSIAIIIWTIRRFSEWGR